MFTTIWDSIRNQAWFENDFKFIAIVISYKLPSLLKKRDKFNTSFVWNRYQYKHQEKYVRVFPNRIALQFLSNNVQLSLFNNVLKYQCSSVPKYQKNKKLNSAQAFLEKCVNQFLNRNVELSPSK